jgi:NADH:ubiquinone oxidoreductase subunit 2 (subunit N)
VLATGVSAGAWVLVMVLIVSRTIGMVYYLWVIVAMFTTPERADADTQTNVLGSYAGRGPDSCP